jgi:hypothetical protein
VHYNHWDSNGIGYINDLIISEGDFYSLEYFKSCNINTNYLEYYGIVKVVKSYIDKIDIETTYNKPIFLPFKPIQIYWLTKEVKACRIFYNILNDSKLPHKLNYMIKWEEKLNTEIKMEDWEKIKFNAI